MGWDTYILEGVTNALSLGCFEPRKFKTLFSRTMSEVLSRVSCIDKSRRCAEG